MVNPDPNNAKVKIMPLGKWRNTLQPTDIPPQCAYITISDHLDMLGLPLFATPQKTMKNSGDELQKKVQVIIGTWLIRFMCITQRPWSINTYLLPKLYHRCHIIPLRQCDVTAVKKQMNRFLFCDQLEKPGPVVQHKPRSSGGLQVHDIECKAKAMLIRSFLETSCIKRYCHFPLHVGIYNYYILEDTTYPKPQLPKFYSDEFISSIKMAIKMGKNVQNMSSKDWYNFLLNHKLLEEEITEEDGTISRVEVKCKTELLNTELIWTDIWELAKMKGLANTARSFLWRLLHNLLPSEQRLFQLKKNRSPKCVLCLENEVDCVWSHSFTTCTFSLEEMNWLVEVLARMDPTITKEKTVFLQVKPTSRENKFMCVWLIAESMEYIWAKRRAKTRVEVENLKTIIKAKLENLALSQCYRKIATNVNNWIV